MLKRYIRSSIYIGGTMSSRIEDAVREKYGEVARSVGTKGCCGSVACGCGDPISSNLYEPSEIAGVPAEKMTRGVSVGLIGELRGELAKLAGADDAP